MIATFFLKEINCLLQKYGRIVIYRRKTKPYWRTAAIGRCRHSMHRQFTLSIWGILGCIRSVFLLSNFRLLAFGFWLSAFGFWLSAGWLVMVVMGVVLYVEKAVIYHKSLLLSSLFLIISFLSTPPHQHIEGEDTEKTRQAKCQKSNQRLESSSNLAFLFAFT